MTQNLTTPGLILLQEVGFDIVSMWGHMGYLAMGVVALAVLTAIGFAVFVISQLLRSLRRRSR